jgi:X-X-X-Leu-X-X-Gly heptad repeat protein
MKVEIKGSDFSSSNINVSHDMTANNDDMLFASAGQVIAKLKSILTTLMSEMREAERERGLTLAFARFKQQIEVYNAKMSEADGKKDAATWKAALDCAGAALQMLGALATISESAHMMGQLANGANSAVSGAGTIKSANITLAAEKLKAAIDWLESLLQESTAMKNNSDETRQRLTSEMESMMKELLAAAKELQQALVK